MKKKKISKNKAPDHCYIPERFIPGKEPGDFLTFEYMRRKNFNDEVTVKIEGYTQKISWDSMIEQIEEGKGGENVGSTMVIGTPDNEDFSLLFASYICWSDKWKCKWLKIGHRELFLPETRYNSQSHIVLWNFSEVLPNNYHQALKSYVWGIRDKHHVIIITPLGVNPVDWHKDTFGYAPERVFVVGGMSYKNINIL